MTLTTLTQTNHGLQKASKHLEGELWSCLEDISTLEEHNKKLHDLVAFVIAMTRGSGALNEEAVRSVGMTIPRSTLPELTRAVQELARRTGTTPSGSMPRPQAAASEDHPHRRQVAVELPSAPEPSRSRTASESAPTPASAQSSGGADFPEWTSETTTVLIQNIPPRCTVAEFLAGFPPDGSYNFLYMPYSVRQRRTSGFVILNFVSPDAAAAFRENAHGSPLPLIQRPCKNLNVYASRTQGLTGNIALAFDKANQEAQSEAYTPIVWSAGREAARLAERHPDCLNVTQGELPQFDFSRLAARLQRRSRDMR